MRAWWWRICAASTGCRARRSTHGNRSVAGWRCPRPGSCAGLRRSAANASRFGENAKLKRLLAEAMLDNAGLKDLLGKRWVTPAVRREAVAHLWASLGVSERRACGIIGADRTSIRYRSRRGGDAALRGRLRELALPASALRLSAPAHPAAARRCEGEPQEDAAALHRGRVDRAHTQVEAARGRHPEVAPV